MSDKIKKYLFDIMQSILSIEEYLGEDTDFHNYQANKMMRRAVEREFEIIGEALNKLIRVDDSINISNSSMIIGMRNRVIHAYDSVDNEIAWGAIIRHMPKLKKEVDQLLNS